MMTLYPLRRIVGVGLMYWHPVLKGQPVRYREITLECGHVIEVRASRRIGIRARCHVCSVR